MNKKIIILNGAARKNGNTVGLVEAFEDGAKSAGNQVKTFYLDGMEIHSCKGCLRAGRDSKSPCSQKDDMDQIYAEFEDADVVVFASPVYFWTITGILKTVADRLYAELECLGYGEFPKKSGIIVIPKSTHIERMKENFATLDFDLEADEMRKIEQLEIGKSLFGWW